MMAEENYYIKEEQFILTTSLQSVSLRHVYFQETARSLAGFVYVTSQSF